MIPPLSLLLSFDHATRLGSMSAAARALGISQPAVSRHLAQLETMLGAALFDRQWNGLVPTSAGLAYHAAVAGALMELEKATGRVRQSRQDRTVRVAANSGFGQQWLEPRLPALNAAIPDLCLRLIAIDRDAAFDPGEFDIGVVFGAGRWPGMSASLLIGERALPVCAPSYLIDHPHLRSPGLRPAALLGERLLHLDEASDRWLTWASWFQAQGVAAPLPRAALLYNSYPWLLQAAVRGEGVALGWLGLIDDDLADGRLVALLPAMERPGHGYFLCRPQRPASNPARSRVVARVAAWLEDSARLTAPGLPRR